jgi:hypothetical protein
MFTAAQKKQAVERELTFRRRVYPRFVEQRKMTQKLADEQIAIFEAIREDYSAAEHREIDMSAPATKIR